MPATRALSFQHVWLVPQRGSVCTINPSAPHTYTYRDAYTESYGVGHGSHVPGLVSSRETECSLGSTRSLTSSPCARAGRGATGSILSRQMNERPRRPRAFLVSLGGEPRAGVAATDGQVQCQGCAQLRSREPPASGSRRIVPRCCSLELERCTAEARVDTARTAVTRDAKKSLLYARDSRSHIPHFCSTRTGQINEIVTRTRYGASASLGFSRSPTKIIYSSPAN